MKNSFFCGTLLFVFLIASVVNADSKADKLFFAQVENQQRTIYIASADGSDLQALMKGKDIVAFSVGSHFLYFTDHQLYEYNFITRDAKLLAKFDENKILVTGIAGNQDGPDQALVFAQTPYEHNLYVLEFTDGSTRLVRSTLASESTYSSLKEESPDEKSLAIIRQASMKYQFEIVIQEKIKNKLKTIWTLPSRLTATPELPLWSPNSRMIAFYAKEYDSIEGFYSLYLYNLDTKKLNLVQEQVFSRFSFNDFRSGPFAPSWSRDSKYLIFQYQPFGLPTGSAIIKYETLSAKKYIITESDGHNQYPSWSPSGNSILFLSNRKSKQDQLYLMDGNGQNLKRISPQEGYTEWAKWIDEGRDH